MITKHFGLFFFCTSLYFIGQFEQIDLLQRIGAYACLGASIPLLLYQLKFIRKIAYGVDDD